jgi:hypothetical protein
VIVANTTFRIAPWADAIFAMDRQWWDTYGKEVLRDFKGARYSSNTVISNLNVTRLPPSAFKPFGNSGAGCIALAHQGEAAKVIMLGYDCQYTGGQRHWHGDHPTNLGNAGSINKWPAKFAELKKSLGSLEVINASRETALDCFPRANLEECLEF